jgi:hypothetical protein
MQSPEQLFLEVPPWVVNEIRSAWELEVEHPTHKGSMPCEMQLLISLNVPIGQVDLVRASVHETHDDPPKVL